MRLNINPGKYVLAVSGGVDSMTLLNLLTKKPGVELVVAHFNHNIREDSGLDKSLVEAAAARYRLIFESGSARLGKTASEAAARDARYGFLRRVQVKYKAKAIITAHHQDDKIETALINILRGTGRQGLAAISANHNVARPLLHVSKKQIIEYAVNHGLPWREDSTNDSEAYLRNYLRLKIVPNLSSQQRLRLISYIDKVAENSIFIDHEIATLSRKLTQNNQINRQSFSNLPADIGSELMIYWLRTLGIRDYDQKTVGRLNTAIRTAKPNSSHPVKHNFSLILKQKSAQISNTL